MFRRTGIISMIGLTTYLFCGMAAPNGCKQPSIVGPAVGAGAIVAAAIIIPVVIVHNHHTLKGCVITDGNGLQIRNDNLKNVTLIGDTPGVKVGDIVKVHGSKKKAKKGSGDDEAFVVEKITKDYGPCKLDTTTPPGPAKAASAPAA